MELLRFQPPLLVLALLSVISIGAAEPVSPRTSMIVTYEEFGAKGDGRTDDFEALAKAHSHANEQGSSVRARDGATYYIGGAKRTIQIQTDTDFGEARFLIDDTKLENHSAPVFRVCTRLKPTSLTSLESLSKGQSAIAQELPGPGLVHVTDTGTRRFIRRGKNRNNGSPQNEVFLVDKAGKVDPRTPIIWDYPNVTHAEFLPIDDDRLTLRGGTFTTIASTRKTTSYYDRGILVERSNVLIDGLTHLVKGEGETGPPYSGFIRISRCSDVVLKEVVLTGRKFYSKASAAGGRVSMGTYDININRSANVALINCTQSNDIMDRSRWGIMGSNFCKNLILEGCSLSRFDAHQGVTHGAIRNSTIGYLGIKLTGGGTFEVENSTVNSRHFISLRPDYGSTWDGDLVIRNCRFNPPPGKYTPTVLDGQNDGQHDFGYPCHLPREILIDGLDIRDSDQATHGRSPAIFANFNPKLIHEGHDTPHAPTITREVKYRGVSTASGKPLRVSENPFMFRNVRITAE